MNIAVKTFHWLKTNNHGHYRGSLQSLFHTVLKNIDQSDNYLYIDQLHKLKLPEAELDFCMCEIYAHQPLTQWTIHGLRETVERLKRLDTGRQKDLRRCFWMKCSEIVPMAMENFDKFEDSDIETLVDFSQLVGRMTHDLVVRILACMTYDMSWTMQAYLALCKRCDWFKDEVSQQRFLLMVYRTHITPEMEKYQRKTDDERAAYKKYLSRTLPHSKPSIVPLSEMICYAIHTFTSRLIFTFEEVRDIVGDIWLGEFQENGIEHAAFFRELLRWHYERWPDYPRNKNLHVGPHQKPIPKRGGRRPE